MGLRFPQPDNEDTFEQMCLRFYRKLWKNEGLQLYGKRGERQDGIDIVDPLCMRPIRAVQCKHHEPTKTIPPSEIKKEVAEAEKSKHAIDHFVIATTAKKSVKAQDAVAELNGRAQSEKKFVVEIHFWEDICLLLGDFKPILAELVVYGQNILAGASEPTFPHHAVSCDQLPHDDAIAVDGPFAEIEDLIGKRQFEAANHELAKLSGEESREPQYMLHRLRGKLAMEVGDFEAASRHFLSAYELSPDLDQAKHNQVLAYWLIEDEEMAVALAEQYIADGLRTAAMLSHFVQNVATLARLEEYLRLIEEHTQTDENLNLSLCHKYLELRQFSKANEAASRALNIAKSSAHAHFAVALCSHNAAVHGGWHDRVHHLDLALEHYNVSYVLATTQKYTLLTPEILSNRAAVKMLSGDATGAAQDFHAAIEVVPKPNIYAENAIAFHLHQGEYVRAWELLVALPRGTTEAQFLALVTEYYNSEETEERHIYVKAMAQLAEADWKRAVECRFHCVQWAIDLRDLAQADTCVTESFRETHPFQAYTLQAWIALERRDVEQAKQYAEKALGESVRSAERQELRLLAKVLVTLEDDINAIGLLEQVATPGVLDNDTKALATCAERLNRHDLLLRICRELRESDQQDEHLRKLELNLLQIYVPEEAFQLAADFCKASNDAYFVAFRNMLAVRLNRIDQLVLEPSRLPTPGQLTPEQSTLVTLPYVSQQMCDKALVFLYRQLRLYYDNQHAHGSYLFFVIQYGQHTEILSAPQVVGSDSAVLLQANADKSRRWVVIEEEHAVPSRCEFSPTHELSFRLIGRKVGDVIELPGGLAQPEAATVCAIQSKYLRAFQDSLENFRSRFPEASILQKVDLSGENGGLDPTPLIESLQQRREHVEECLSIYREHPCTIFLFAERVGLNELNALKCLAQNRVRQNGIVRCCQVSTAEFENAVAAGIGTKCIVMDLSAIITVTLVKGWQCLDQNKNYLVSRTTLEVVENWLHETDEGNTPKGFAWLTDNGQLVVVEATDEQLEARRRELESIIDGVKSHCQVRSSKALAELDPEKRMLYTKIAGFHNVEAMSVARDENAVLWTDDFVLSLISTTDFGVGRVWTQLAMRWFVASNKLTAERFERITAKLAAWNYMSTIWNPATIIAAGEEAEWDPSAWPLAECLTLFKAAPLPLSGRTRLVAKFLQLFRRSKCSEWRQSAVIQACLDAFDNVTATRWLLSRIDDLFPIDVPSAKFMRLQLQYWLRLR